MAPNSKNMPPPLIEAFETARLKAHRIREDDFSDLCALHQDPKVMAWIAADGQVWNERRTRQSLEHNLDHWRRHHFGLWILRTIDGDRFVGRAGLRHTTVDGQPEIELSYALGSNWWNRGLATEISRALIALAFERLGIERVVSYTLPHNRASRRVMEKLGFRYERDFLHAELPHVLYRLERTPMTHPTPKGYLTCGQVRELDRRAVSEYGMTSLVLMENAGRGAAELLLALGVRGPVVICCGKGNNGGDGLVIARHLHNAEVDVKVLLFASPADLSADAAANRQTVQRGGVPAEVWQDFADDLLAAELARADWVVDALYGTGLQGPVRPPYDRVIAAINASPARKFAVDIPSGLNGDTGEPQGATVRADHTATFVAPKIGFANPTSAKWLGKVHVIGIGLPLAACGNTNPP